jgi:general stress protein 26
MKKVIKFLHENKEGFLSVVEKDHDYYTLVRKDAPKVKKVENTGQLSIAYDIKTPTYKDVSVGVSYDVQTIKWVYDRLNEQNNLYFKKLDDSLCVLRINRE